MIKIISMIIILLFISGCTRPMNTKPIYEIESVTGSVVCKKDLNKNSVTYLQVYCRRECGITNYALCTAEDKIIDCGKTSLREFKYITHYPNIVVYVMEEKGWNVTKIDSNNPGVFHVYAICESGS